MGGSGRPLGCTVMAAEAAGWSASGREGDAREYGTCGSPLLDRVERALRLTFALRVVCLERRAEADIARAAVPVVDLEPRESLLSLQGRNGHHHRQRFVAAADVHR